jgi:hypothetical protein
MDSLASNYRINLRNGFAFRVCRFNRVVYFFHEACESFGAKIDPTAEITTPSTK